MREKGIPVPDYNEVRYNGSLVLGNSNVAIGDAVSLPQSYKHIGGYHIDEEVKPLPEVYTLSILPVSLKIHLFYLHSSRKMVSRVHNYVLFL